MPYFEVLIADGRYHGNEPLTYSSPVDLPLLSIVSVPLRQKVVTGFVVRKTKKPGFEVKPVKSVMSTRPLPGHCLELAKWLSTYYACSLADALRQFAPAKPAIRRQTENALEPEAAQIELTASLTAEQVSAIQAIENNPSTTVLLHGETGSGKTRAYLELAKKTLASGRSVILLTPEISLTPQLAAAAAAYLGENVHVLHSQLSQAQRKKIWFRILESENPVVVIGPRSALFSPVKKIGLIVVDEAHEPAYKQDQTPRFQATRTASQLGKIAGAKVILGTATPLLADYYLAEQRKAIVRMTRLAAGASEPPSTAIVDIKDRANFSRSQILSNQLIDAINSTLSAKQQIIIYLNRRGTARIILCNACGWQLLCPNCDIPLVYHGDEHIARCHTCGHKQTPPVTCPDCDNPDIIFRSIGTKSLYEEVTRLFPNAAAKRFDSDNIQGERLNELYGQIKAGKVDILVGTQLLAKGLDLPRLALVGIITAETSLGLPDYTAEERTYQLLYQVIGRVGRGHVKGSVIIQSYEPGNHIIQAAAKRSWQEFYRYGLGERQQFRFPPFSYLLQLTCHRASLEAAEAAATTLRDKLRSSNKDIEIIGPSPPFYSRRGRRYYNQLVVKSKSRQTLVELASQVPPNWQINLDPSDLL